VEADFGFGMDGTAQFDKVGKQGRRVVNPIDRHAKSLLLIRWQRQGAVSASD
jgi:hypothetical protein